MTNFVHIAKGLQSFFRKFKKETTIYIQIYTWLSSEKVSFFFLIDWWRAYHVNCYSSFKETLINTHTHTHIYICIYMCTLFLFNLRKNFFFFFFLTCSTFFRLGPPCYLSLTTLLFLSCNYIMILRCCNHINLQTSNVIFYTVI